MVSNGKLTSYSPTGTLNWQIDTSSGWSKPEQKNFGSHGKESAYNLLDFAQQCFRPTLEAYSSNPLTDQDQKIVATGWHKMTIVGPRGSVMAEFELPEPPIASPVFADLTGDGNQDILLVGRTAYYGIKIDHRRGSAFMSYLLYLIIATLLVVFVRQAVLHQKDPRKRGHRGTD